MAVIDKLGNYIERLNRPNSDLRYGIDDVCGITNTKQLVTGTKANLIGRTFEKFTILAPREFIFNRRTSRNGERISLGYNTTDREWILTEDYCHFRVRKDKENILDPDFLYLFFLNPEFDRYARFNSWGSATEFFNWEEIIETPIPILPIDEQRRIVHDYQVITDRIELLRKINEKLEEQVYCLFKSFVSGIEKNGTLSDLAIITMGISPEGETINSFCEGLVFYQGRSDFGFRFPSVRLYTTNPVRRAKCNDILISVRAPVGDINIAKEDCAIGRGLASIRSKDENHSFIYYTMKDLYFDLQRFNDEGTVFGAISKDDLANQKVVLLNPTIRQDFESKAESIDACIRNFEFEIFALKKIRNNLLSGISKGA